MNTLISVTLNGKCILLFYDIWYHLGYGLLQQRTYTEREENEAISSRRISLRSNLGTPFQTFINKVWLTVKAHNI